MQNEVIPKPSLWQQFIAVCKNPISTLSDKTKDSPLVTILAIVFILQPVISTTVDIVKAMVEVKQTLDPLTRPVTKAELDIVNAKIDFIQQLIVTNMQRDTSSKPNPVITSPVVKSPEKVVPYVELQRKLNDVQTRLDLNYKSQAKK